MSRVLIGCEESQAVCIEFRKLGVEAYSCDLQECSGGHPEWHLQMDLFEAIEKVKPVLSIMHPPCTYLTVTANKWLADQPPLKSGALVGEARREARREAIKFFMRCINADVKMICVENPVGCMSTEYRPADQIIQPYYFGDPHRKTTCLWLKNLPHLYHNDRPNLFDEVVTHVDQGESAYWLDSKTGKLKRQPLWYASVNPKNRSRERSKSFMGMAQAMAKQWSELL